MAAIDIDDCTVTQESLPGFNVWKIVTPATADDADTVDISSIIDGSDVVSAQCSAATDGNLPVASITEAGVLTIPGSTDNEARTIWIMGKNA
jgi:hypothetical protein